jgi:uncharacterized glyoxalase superfamily protein PhnB
MARTSTYLNFMGNTEEAFGFYRRVFRTEFSAPIQRMGDVPAGPGMPTLSDDEKKMVMHVELPILAGHALMGTDAGRKTERLSQVKTSSRVTSRGRRKGSQDGIRGDGWCERDRKTHRCVAALARSEPPGALRGLQLRHG